MANEKLVILKNAFVITYTDNDMPSANFSLPAKSRVPLTITPKLMSALRILGNCASGIVFPSVSSQLGVMH